MKNFYTKDLTHWPQVRHLEPNFLAQVDRFYLVGKILLVWTYEDHVYESHCDRFPDGQHFRAKWSDPIHVNELSGQGVISIAHGHTNIAALTSLGHLLLWPREWREIGIAPRKVLSRIVMIHGENYFNSLFAVDADDTVWSLDRLEPCPVKELSRHGRVVSISCSAHQMMAITASGLCLLALLPHPWSINSFKEVRVRVLHYQPPSRPISVVWFQGWNVLTLDGQLYRYGYGCLCCRKPRHLPLNEPVRCIYGHGRTINEQLALLTNSGRLYQYSTRWMESSLTSVADLMATMSGTLHFTPDLVTITAHARTMSNDFNNPRKADLQRGWISFKLWWKPLYLNSSVLSQIVSSPFRESELAYMPLGEMDFKQRYQTLFSILYYLHSSDPRQLLNLHFRLYIVALQLKNESLQAIATRFTTHLLCKLYRREPVLLRECLEYALKPLMSSQNIRPVTLTNDDHSTRTRPIGSLAARVLTHLIIHALNTRNHITNQFEVIHLFQP